MEFIASAFGGWLVGQVATASQKRLGAWLLGSEQEQALRQAATAATQTVAQQLRPGSRATDDEQGADHLARVIDHVFQVPVPAESLTLGVTLLQGLQAAVAAQLAVLDDVNLTGMEQSSAALLGVSAPALADLLTTQLLRELIRRGASGGPLAPLADQLNHDLTHLQGQEHNARLGRLSKDMQGLLATVRQQTGSVPGSVRPPLGRPIHELTDPFALEVHRAIDVPDGTTPLPALPAYVERDHDRQLRAVVERAASGHSAAAMLVGGSSTGKTRACWEAVQTLPQDWRLWHPIDPSRPAAAVDALSAVGPRTVIWLNEAQHYLLTPTSPLGERVAAGLRELLRDPSRGPILLLGTIWPEYWATLTTPPAPDREGEDPHAQARVLLTGIDISVPDAFTEPGLHAVKAAAKADPRLAEAAARAADGRITQFLAGGPAVLERYRNAPAAAKALIEGAMDARRLGHSLYLPHRLLEAGAPGYLTDQQWDELGEDWLEQALAYCAKPCRGARGPLTRVRPRPGQPVPVQPLYRLADYLEQTGRTIRRTVLPPSRIWDALTEHADEGDRLRIADEAADRGLYQIAFRVCQRVAQTSDSFELEQAAQILERIGRIDEAIGWHQRAADAGQHDALGQVAWLLEQAGRVEEAIDWLGPHAEAGGNSFYLWRMAGLLERAGRLNEAIAMYRRAAEAGDRDAPGQAGWLLEQAGRIDEAIDMYRHAAQAGDRHALRQVARLLEEAGHIEEAIQWLQAGAALAGDPDALKRVARLLEQTGRIEEAIEWLQTRAEAGDRYALALTDELLDRAGRLDEAAAMYKRAAEVGNPFAIWRLTQLLEKSGRTDEAIDLYKQAAEAGEPGALGQMTRLLTASGRVQEAIEWAQTRAAATGDLLPLREVTQVVERSGRIEERIALYQRIAELGDHRDLVRAAEALEGASRIEEAIDFFQRAAEAGNAGALWRVTSLLEQAGRGTDAIPLYRRVVEAGHHEALSDATALLERAGHIEEALALCERSAEAGNDNARWQMAGLLERAGRLDEAIAMYRRVGEAGDSYAFGDAAKLVEEAGRHEEAISLYRLAGEAGYPDATQSAARLLEQVGRLEEAITWLQARAASGGYDAYDALESAVKLLQRVNRIDEAFALYQRAVEAGDHDALEAAARLLNQAGRLDEAITWLQMRAAAGDTLALELAARLLEEAGRTDEAINVHLWAAEIGQREALGQACKLLEHANRFGEAFRLRKYGLEPGGHIAVEWY
jgi:tetratricopeptide (TPR) repeat protein